MNKHKTTNMTRHFIKRSSYRTVFNGSPIPALGLWLFVLAFAPIGTYLLFSSHASTLSGDINGDGIVNITDLSLLLSTYNKNQSTCATNTSYTCDINGDGTVNVFDLSTLLSNYGQSDTSTNLIPNPSFETNSF